MSPDAPPLRLRMQKVRKSFPGVLALDDVDLEVAAGEVHGFLGPNGSGKSTTIRVLLGLLRADAGRVTLLNPVAQALTGWSEASAIGQPIETVFHIVQEETRRPSWRTLGTGCGAYHAAPSRSRTSWPILRAAISQ